MGALLGGAAGAGTIGGVIAANLSGPRRIKAGAARDHFLGVTAVSGRGETFKSGGRVVKNVTGYDLCKLLAGSWGTLAAMTDVTIKTLPRAETEETVLVLDLDDATAGKVMAAAMGFVRRRVGRGASAGRRCRADRRDGVRANRGDGVPPRRRRAFGGAAQKRAGEPARAVRLARHARRSGLARAVARDPRCDAVRGGRCRGQARSLAHFDGADARRRCRRRARRRRPTPNCSTTGPAGSSGRRCRLRTTPTRRSCARPSPAWRPRHAHPRAGRRARRGRCLYAGSAGACRIDQAGAGGLRSARRAQCRAHVGGRVSHANLLHAGAACRSGHRGVGKDPARLRALRLLHRDLSDLCARRQRARFAARAHLPDQGHAGARPAGDGGGDQAHRPLPVVPRLHDDLPVRRPLHASRRSCPRPYRGNLPPPARRALAARDAGHADALSAALPAGAARRAARQAVRAARRGARAQAACRDAAAGAVAGAAPPARAADFSAARVRAKAASRSLPAASTTC